VNDEKTLTKIGGYNVDGIISDEVSTIRQFINK
jgi:hypothetical protein